MEGVIIIILVVLAVLFFFNSYQNKYQSLQGNLYNFIVVGALLFFVGTGIFVYSRAGIEVNSVRDLFSFFKVYLSWLGSFFSGTKSIVGNVVKSEWTSNLTNFTR